MAGNSTALREIWERLDGKVTTPLEIEAEASIPLIRIEFLKAGEPGQSRGTQP
jgi:hypothetical protein